jgi:hypothetical protein
MSDYLWDKTGERDPEVGRLEGLLGGLRFGPGELELPPAAAPRPVRARLGPFAWGALAAALALAGVAGVIAVSREASGDAGSSVAASAGAREIKAGVGTGEAGRDVVTRPPAANEFSVGPEAVTPEHLSAGGASDGLRSIVAPPPASVRRVGTGASPRRGRPRVAPARASEGAPMTVAAAPDGRRGAEAKEQLIYALRLTGAKLEEVRRRTRGDAEAGDAVAPRARTR